AIQEIAMVYDSACWVRRESIAGFATGYKPVMPKAMYTPIASTIRMTWRIIARRNFTKYRIRCNLFSDSVWFKEMLVISSFPRWQCANPGGCHFVFGLGQGA